MKAPAAAGESRIGVVDRQDFTFLYPLRVRWSECDAQGIVFNVNYFLYFDIGIWEYTRALGYRKGDAPEFVTVSAQANYRAPATFDDEIEVGVRTARFGTKSVTKAFAVFRGGATLADGAMTYVAVERGTTRSAPLEPEYMARVRAFEKIPPDEPTA